MNSGRLITFLTILAFTFMVLWITASISILKEDSGYIQEVKNLEELVSFYQVENMELQTELYELKKGKE